MEILLQLGYRDSVRYQSTFELSKKDKEKFKKQLQIENVCDIELVNIGTSADWVVLHIVLEAIKYSAGINGCIELAKKIQKLANRKKIISIDKQIAESLAINRIIKNEKTINSLEKLNESTINLSDLSEMLPQNNGICAKPYNYYILTYRVNNNKVYILGIKSTGKSEILKRFTVGLYGEVEETKK